ncbi:MAG: hypothetical protein Q8K99_03865 [Actinomycetota bacterium]|nr:hypothetical protein [Actinomycetota bacterium]
MREISNLAEFCPGCGAPVSSATIEPSCATADEPYTSSPRSEEPAATADSPRQNVLGRILGVAGVVLGLASLAMPYTLAIVVVVVAVACGVVAILRRHRVLGAATLIAAAIGLVALIYVAQHTPSITNGTGSPGAPSGDGSAVVTSAEYDQLTEGMTYQEVVAVIGAEGEESEGSEVDGFPTVMFTWTNPDGSNMNVMLHNGKLVKKTQVGLP